MAEHERWRWGKRWVRLGEEAKLRLSDRGFCRGRLLINLILADWQNRTYMGFNRISFPPKLVATPKRNAIYLHTMH